MSGAKKLLVPLTGLAAGFLFLCAMRATARTLTLADLRKSVTLADPQISPDGSRIAVLVARQDFRTDRMPVKIVMVDVATGASRSLPAPSSDIAFVRWSSSGDRIAYLASVGDGPKQLYVSSPAGADRRKITDAPQGVNYFSWRPDGRAIGYGSVDPTPKRTGNDRFNTSFVAGAAFSRSEIDALLTIDSSNSRRAGS